MISAGVSAQKTETYYDFNWKPCEPGLARYFGTVEKTDSGWLRNDYYMFSQKIQLQMQALYEDAGCKVQNGSCRYYHPNGNPSLIGRRLHGKRDGVCVSYHSNGMMADSAYWQNDRPSGNRYQWHRNGYLSDSTAHLNDSMDVMVSWFDDGNPEAAGRLLHGEFHGRWQFFHRNGTIAGEELYERGRVITKTYFNEDGSPQPDTAKANSEAAFKKGGLGGWQRYLQENVRWPNGYKLENTDQVTVGVYFCINEEGKVTDAEMYVPFDPVFDKAALDIVRRSPPWKPFIRNNRKMKFWFRQPLTFQQE